MATAPPVKLPAWQPPREPAAHVRAQLPRLRVYNSLTRTKVPFIPLDPEGKTVSWYACGPTVYDDAHLGHARNYVSTDVIRRILTRHFKFNVNFVMNITDVDDKIIIAARQQHFLGQYRQKHPQIDADVLGVSLEAYKCYLAAQLPLISKDTAPKDFAVEAQTKYGHVLQGNALANDGSKPKDKEAKIKMHLKTVSSAALALAQPFEHDVDALYDAASGILLPYLDTLHKAEIDPSDHTIFKQLAKHYELRFFQDMDSLNVLRPDRVTRVIEYGPEIVEYVKNIQANGFAYENEGSVYYDTRAWESSGGVYARLEPWNKNDKDLLDDGEGALSKTTSSSFSRPATDFALWKASKKGEPGWESPWGIGRPGWHIECSCMASDVLGQQMDIHSGGIDLAFPHHDNELAQSEAYWSKPGEDGKQWVNYFLHMGHLSISGAKMSKSLKNFTTIRHALAKGDWTARSLRIAFLLGAWNSGLEITADVIVAGRAWEERLDNIFLKVLDTTRRASRTAVGTSSPADEALLRDLAAAQQAFDEALCDSFNTPDATEAVSNLLTSYNSHDQREAISDAVTIAVARWLDTVVDVFGLDAHPSSSHIGWSGIDIPDAAKPYVYPLSALRDEVRRQAIGGDVRDPVKSSAVDLLALSTAPSDEQSVKFQSAWSAFVSELTALIDSSARPKQYLDLCDKLRDNVLWDLGIYLEDRSPRPDGVPRSAMVRPLNSTLKEERQSREALQALKLEKQASARQKADKEEAERRQKASIKPLDMFRTSEYSAWDEEGMPVKDCEGKDVAKSKLKKLRKEWERQTKLYETYKNDPLQTSK